MGEDVRRSFGITRCVGLVALVGVFSSPVAADERVGLRSEDSAAPWSGRSEDGWPFQPLQHYAITAEGLDREQVLNPIDTFVLQRLQEKGLRPAPPADRVTLMRRAAYDLTGLPPTPEETRAFVHDPSPDAFGKVVDRLLASPHYGEQWGRHWLDVARYADTSGFSNDYERPSAWRYRDYVIRSFNEDKPYDRFIVEQIAGDELDPDEPEMEVATGYLRMGPWEHTSMSVAAVTRQQFLDDVTNNVGVTFLAMGLRCARCHDHKFDPIPTRDYYRLQAVFAPVQFAQRSTPFLPSENTVGFAQDQAEAQERLEETRRLLRALQAKHKRAVQRLLKEKGVQSVEELPAESRPSRHFGLSTAEMGLQKIYRKRIGYFERQVQRYEPLSYSVYNGSLRVPNLNRASNPPPKKDDGKVQETFVLLGGLLQSTGERVTPGVLSAVTGRTLQQLKTIPNTTHGRRLALARWIASSDNPLTARVMVNRIWQHHFGRGIVATSNNFGKMGERATHPELLDWLASYFLEHGWSIKAMHRLIITSATYQRSSEHPDTEQVRQVDSGNHLLAYFPPRRLTAEELRDSMLAVSGELVRRVGGPGTFPLINWEVALQPRHIMGSVAPAYQPSRTPHQRNRRAIYAFHFRTLPDPVLELFNAPNPDLSCERREASTVVPQVFSLFNGQASHDRALAMARRLENLSAVAAEQIDHAFRLSYGRPPTPSERKLCLEHLEQMTDYHRKHKPDALPMPRQVVRSMVEELTGEPYEWVEALDQMANFQPDLKPWDVGPRTRALADLCLVLLNSNEFLYVY